MKKISFTLGIILMIILICTSCAHIPSADNGFYFSDYAQEKPNELSETIITTNSTTAIPVTAVLLLKPMETHLPGQLTVLFLKSSVLLRTTRQMPGLNYWEKR